MYKIEARRMVAGDEVRTIRRLSDNACIPIDPPKEMTDPETGEKFIVGGNADYVQYLEWVAQGNEAEVVDLTPVPALEERRQAEYDKRGCTTSALIVAMWEKVVEERSDEADRLQAIREQVKIDIPKEALEKRP